jgi:hypothetical protein
MYTENDAEFDANIIVSEYFDLSTSFIMTDYSSSNVDNTTKAVYANLKDSRINHWMLELLNIFEINKSLTKQIDSVKSMETTLFDYEGKILNQGIDVSDEFLSTLGISRTSINDISLKQLTKDMERKLIFE